MFHIDTNNIFARLTHADRNKEFMHFTIVHKFLVFSSFSPELFFFVGSNQTSTLKFKRHNLYKSDFNDQNSLSYASIVLDKWKVLFSKWVVTNRYVIYIHLMDLIYSLHFSNFIKFHSISEDICYNTYLLNATKNDSFEATKNQPYFSTLKGNIDKYVKNYLSSVGMSFWK